MEQTVIDLAIADEEIRVWLRVTRTRCERSSGEPPPPARRLVPPDSSGGIH